MVHIRSIYKSEGKKRHSNREYFLYDNFPTYEQALAMAQFLKKKEGIRYYIQKGNITTTLGFPKDAYLLFTERYKPALL